jgi:D-arabinose 1-dehydrogenase-like Zn-dependent alcohol dehydrogenase
VSGQDQHCQKIEYNCANGNQGGFSDYMRIHQAMVYKNKQTK